MTLTELVVEARAGSATARNEIIVECLTTERLVSKAVGKVLKQWPNKKHLEDELTSQGYVALVEGVDGFLATDREASELRAYVVQTIKYQCFRLFEEQPEIQPELLVDDTEIFEIFDILPQPENNAIRDALESCATKRQEQIVELRANGLKEYEICERLGLQAKALRSSAQRVEHRFFSLA